MKLCAGCNQPFGSGDHHHCQPCHNLQTDGQSRSNDGVLPRFESAPVPTPEEIEARCCEIRRGWSEEVLAMRAGNRAHSGIAGWQPPMVRGSDIGLFEDAPWP